MHYYNELFTITNEEGYYRRKWNEILQFKAYNSRGEQIGVIRMNDDKQKPAYGKCEFHNYEKYRTQYGEWHIIRSHGQYIPFQKVYDILSKQSEYKIYVD